METIDKVICKFHEIENKEKENWLFYPNKKYHKVPPSYKIWFAGLRKWGKEFINREYELGRKGII